MELKIYNPTEEGFVKAIEWNHEEIKKEVSEKVGYYASLVYTDEQIKDAKSDRATLNKFIDALETKRKEIKKMCLAPYENFEKQIKEIVAIVNEPILLIDKQVKEYEEKQKQDKLDAITGYFEETLHPAWLHFSQIMDNKWLNLSVSLKSVQKSIDEKIEQIATDLNTLSSLPEFSFEATEVYKSSLDINRAILEAKRMSDMAKAKAEHEAKMRALEEEQARLKAEEELAKAMNPPVEEEKTTSSNMETVQEPQKQWIKFQALLSTDDAIALKKFFDDRNIEFKAV